MASSFETPLRGSSEAVILLGLGRGESKNRFNFLRGSRSFVSGLGLEQTVSGQDVIG